MHLQCVIWLEFIFDASLERHDLAFDTSIFVEEK